MSDIYAKLEKARDEVWKEFKNDRTHAELREEVLKDLLLTAFFNEANPGELPNSFTLEKVMLFSRQLETLLAPIENVTITKIGNSYPSGYIYHIAKTQG